MNKKYIAVISFTVAGDNLAITLARQAQETGKDIELHPFTKRKEHTLSTYVTNLSMWVQEQFDKKHAILFIGACGIAVRLIAPFVKDKLTDSPVLVMDEKKQFIIPILAGHMGGANKLAIEVSQMAECMPVITTATDVQNCMAIDVFAKNHDLAIANREGVAKVSEKVLEHKKLTLSIEQDYGEQVDIEIAANHSKESLLTLIPREYILGIGCKKGKEPVRLADFIETQLEENHINWKQVKAIATIDIKKDELAITSLARNQNIPLYTFDAKTLQNIEGAFSHSDFVAQNVGVGNVCERSAMAACGQYGKLILEKQSYDGMTMAIAKQDWRITLYEE